jgi:hypothetical protein
LITWWSRTKSRRAHDLKTWTTTWSFSGVRDCVTISNPRLLSSNEGTRRLKIHLVTPRSPTIGQCP